MVFATCAARQVRQLLGESSLGTAHILSVSIAAAPHETPNSLGDIYTFSQSILAARHDHPGKTLVLCAEHDPEMVTRCALLLGGFLIVCDGLAVAQVTEVFHSVSHRFVPFQHSSRASDAVQVTDCWRALHRARQHGWIDFTSDDVDVDRCIDMCEHLHYDHPANGGLHVLVPGMLLAIACPRDLPAAVTWSDVGGVRRFAPAFYTDILGDFGVRLVARCGGLPYDTRALVECGIAVEDLREAPTQCADGYDATAHSSNSAEEAEEEEGGPTAGLSVLRAADRLMTLARLTPGAIAMHGGKPCGSLGAGGQMLAQTYLIRRHGFGGPDALAWLLIAHPPPAALGPTGARRAGGGAWLRWGGVGARVGGRGGDRLGVTMNGFSSEEGTGETDWLVKSNDNYK